MQRSTGVAIASVVGVAAIAAPIMISIQLAWHQSITGEESRSLSYAQDVMRRSDETGKQFAQAINRLNHDNFPPCSPDEIELMRQIDLGSSYIQAVGRESGNALICTSLDTSKPIPLGPPQLFSNTGTAERNFIQLPIAPSSPLSVLSRDGIAILLDPSLVVDTPTEGPGISIAVFVPSSPKHPFIAAHGNNLRPEWLRIIPKGSKISFRDAGYLISEVRSAKYDLAVVVAVPELYADQRAREFAFIFVPIGLLCGAGLAWAVMYISRIHLSLPSVLRAAAKRGDFYLEYQPVVELATRRWIGAEALVRWQRSGRIVRPDQFIPIAEESGVITLITEQVVKMVGRDLPKLIQLDSRFEVAINLSAADLTSGRTIELLEQAIQTSGARPSNIEIEATERGFLQGAAARELLARIRTTGISVAIDDFGTGYSSLSCLQTLGLDTLKIDKAFVDTIGTDGATSHVVLHIIEMSHSLNLDIVAEGVETEAQAEFLRKRGVKYAQGWLFGKPMAIEILCEMLAARLANTPENAATLHHF
jgi:sensor c-di-GMP phosphodiesterase-like protein